MPAYSDEDVIEEFMRSHSTPASRRHANRKPPKARLVPQRLPESKNGAPVVGDIVRSTSWPGIYVIIGLAKNHETVDRFGRRRMRSGGFHLQNAATGELRTVGVRDVTRESCTAQDGTAHPLKFTELEVA